MDCGTQTRFHANVQLREVAPPCAHVGPSLPSRPPIPAEAGAAHSPESKGKRDRFSCSPDSARVATGALRRPVQHLGREWMLPIGDMTVSGRLKAAESRCRARSAGVPSGKSTVRAAWSIFMTIVTMAVPVRRTTKPTGDRTPRRARVGDRHAGAPYVAQPSPRATPPKGDKPTAQELAET